MPDPNPAPSSHDAMASPAPGSQTNELRVSKDGAEGKGPLGIGAAFLLVLVVVLVAWMKGGGPSQQVSGSGNTATQIGDVGGNAAGRDVIYGMTFDDALRLVDKFAEPQTAALAEERARREAAENEIEDLRANAAEGILRAAGNGGQHGDPPAESALEVLRQSGDAARVQAALIAMHNRKRDDIIQSDREIAAIAYLRGDIEIAQKALREILAIRPNDPGALNRIALIDAMQGRLAEAEAGLTAFLGVAESDEQRAAALGNLGILDAKRGDVSRAEEHFRQALEIFEELGQPESMAIQRANLGTLYNTRGDMKTALENWHVARDLYRRLGAPHKVQVVQSWIDKAEGRAGGGD